MSQVFTLPVVYFARIMDFRSYVDATMSLHSIIDKHLSLPKLVMSVPISWAFHELTSFNKCSIYMSMGHGKCNYMYEYGACLSEPALVW